MILHITNDYAGSTVYKNLISNLDDNGIKQIVYTPVKSEKSINGNLIELKEKSSKIIYSNILNKHLDRVLFHVKINKIYKDIHSKVDFNKIKCIHAHTWFSDGAVALKLHKEFDIPYLIAVRSSDLNPFWKLPHLKSIGLEILKHAEKIVFITSRYQERLLEINQVKKLGDNFSKKTISIPNGLNPFWVENTEPKKVKINSPIQLLYIGLFTKRKNILKLAKCVEVLNDEGINCRLTLVGGGGDHEKEISNLINHNPNFEFLGKVRDKNQLKEIFRKTDIFTMTSLKETFGLVYGEALSQGIPVLYSKNEGIDGVFKENIGVAVDPRSMQSIAEGIKKMIADYEKFNFDPLEIVEKLNWKNITQKYIAIYQQIENN